MSELSNKDGKTVIITLFYMLEKSNSNLEDIKNRPQMNF